MNTKRKVPFFFNRNNKYWAKIEGRRAGVPECCIQYWITAKSLDPERFLASEQREKYPDIPSYVEYIVCPRCIKNRNFVKVDWE